MKSHPSSYDPYAGNMLIKGLGPILSPEEAGRKLVDLPARPPSDIGSIPRHIRLHMLQDLRRLHLPSLEGIQTHQTMDLMIRQNYKHTDPTLPNTWTLKGGEASQIWKRSGSPAFGAAVEGISGAGKTEAITRALHLFPTIIEHESFPKMVGTHTQVTWISTDVPPGGKPRDLAVALMSAWMRTTGSDRFEDSLQRKSPRSGMAMLEEWRQVASSHFLGFLHLDEVQNFFKLSPLEVRRRVKDRDATQELSVQEDQSLRWLLNLMNVWQIPLLVSGTPDGIGALTKRLSTTERFVTSGFHSFQHFADPLSPTFKKTFLAPLSIYQYVATPLQITDDVTTLIVEKTAGVQRLIIALWVAAHRVAFERKDDDLRIEDFEVAADTLLSPIGPAVIALRSNNPLMMARYEDLTARDQTFWQNFWSKRP